MVDFGATVLTSALAIFGRDYPYYPPNSEEPAATVTGDFKLSAEVVDLDGQAPVSSFATVILVALSSATTGPEIAKFPAGLEPQVGGRFLIDDVFYSIYNRQPDGIGGMLLLLHKAE